MAATTQPNIGTKEGYSVGDNGWTDDYNFFNRAMDGLVQPTIKAIQTSPPGSPVRGDCYIVGGSGSGAWAGWDARFVRYTGSAWDSWVPKAGWKVFNQGDSKAYTYKSGSWVADNAEDIGALPSITISSGSVDFNAINTSKPCIAKIYGSAYVNAPPGAVGGRGYSLLQMSDKDGRLAQIAVNSYFGGAWNRFQTEYASNAWSSWFVVWDSGTLPVSTFMKTVLDDTNAAAACSTLGAVEKYSGTANRLPKSDGSGVLSDSGISDDGGKVDASTRDIYGKIFRSAWAASDTAVGGSSFAVLDAMSYTKGWMLQLGASNDLSFWNYASSSWVKSLAILTGGIVKCASAQGGISNRGSSFTWDNATEPNQGIVATASLTATLPAPSATYAGQKRTITATGSFTVTLSCATAIRYVQRSSAVWSSNTSVAIAMQNAGQFYQIDLYCDGNYWHVLY